MSVTYVCPACGHGALGPGNCPSCLKGRKYVRLRPQESIGAVPMALVVSDRLPRLPVPGFPQIESVMNGGFVRGSVTLLYGGAGLGKTTLCLKLADRITRVWSRPALFCSTEQPQEHVKMAAMRAGVSDGTFLVAYETNAEAIVRIMGTVRPPFVVIDSLSNLASREPIVPLTADLVETARTIESAVLLILHETKDGDYNAPRQVEHLVDCMARLTGNPDLSLDEQGAPIPPWLDWTIVGKYRFGPINRIAHLRFDAGKVPYDPDAGPPAY